MKRPPVMSCLRRVAYLSYARNQEPKLVHSVYVFTTHMEMQHSVHLDTFKVNTLLLLLDEIRNKPQNNVNKNQNKLLYLNGLLCSTSVYTGSLFLKPDTDPEVKVLFS